MKKKNEITIKKKIQRKTAIEAFKNQKYYLESYVCRVTEHFANSFHQEIIPEGVSSFVPTQLSSDAISNGSDKFSAQPKFLTQLNGKLLRAVIGLRHVPLKLIHQTYISHVDI